MGTGGRIIDSSLLSDPCLSASVLFLSLIFLHSCFVVSFISVALFPLSAIEDHASYF